MSTLICGSIAFDSIMVFHDRFRQSHPARQLHILNVSFFVPEMRREFGGCAGNIAYNLKLLGGEPLIMATVGDDATLPDRRASTSLGLPRTTSPRCPAAFTAQAFITTDLDDNQITAFHPGAMVHSHLNKVATPSGVRLGIVSPDGRDGMLEHTPPVCRGRHPLHLRSGPGPAACSTATNCSACLQLADYCTVND